MTTTSTDTTNLAGILAAKKAEIVHEPERPSGAIFHGDVYHEVMPAADVVTGEIVPETAVEVSPIPPAVPAPVEVRYPEIPPKVVGGLPYIRDYVKLARTIDQTEMVPVAFRGRYDAITAAFMRGYEMGLGPMQALDSFNVIQGKVGLTAEAMRALILNAGHDIILEEVYSGAKESLVLVAVKASCHRKQWSQDRWAEYVYSLEDARRVGLVNKTSWKENTRAMLDARATSGAGRRYFADVLAGMSYTPEEIRDFSGPDQEVTPSPAPESPSDPTPTTQSSGRTAPTDPPSSDTGNQPATTPKRPRGRPRKAPTAPTDVPGPSAAETQAAPVTELQLVDGPELTSLNDSGVVIQQMLRVLTQTIKSLPSGQQPECRAFIRLHFPDGTSALSEADVQKCIDIAAGWPDSEAQHPVPEPELPF